MKELFAKLISSVMMTCLVVCALASCNEAENTASPQAGTQITISDDGYWVIDGVKTEHKATGEKGDKGDKGDKGENSTAFSVEIVDGYWYIDGENTGVLAQGEKGDKGDKGDRGDTGYTPIVEIVDGYWCIDGESTGVLAQGPQGERGYDGHTPYISINEEGYWCIDGEITGVLAQGPQGEAGTTCDHSGSIASYALIEHTSHTPGTYIEFCKNCHGYSRIVEEVRHTLEYSPRFIEPTCTTDGGYVFCCEICGYAMAPSPDDMPIPALGHSFGDYKYVHDIPASLVDNADLYIANCERCSSCSYEFRIKEGSPNANCPHRDDNDMIIDQYISLSKYDENDGSYKEYMIFLDKCTVCGDYTYEGHIIQE